MNHLCQADWSALCAAVIPRDEFHHLMAETDALCARSSEYQQLGLSCSDACMLYLVAKVAMAHPGSLCFEYAGGMGLTTHTVLTALKTLPLAGQRIVAIEKDPHRFPHLEHVLPQGGPYGEAVLADARAWGWLATLDIKMLVIDGQHGAADAEWYTSTVFPRVIPGGWVWMHDMGDHPDSAPELRVVMASLEASGLMVVARNDGGNPSCGPWHRMPNSHPGVRSSCMVLRKQEVT